MTPKRGLSRRSLLAGALAAPVAVACSNGRSRPPAATPEPTAEPSGASVVITQPPTPTIEPSPSTPRARTGGATSIASPRAFSFDTLAPHLADDVSAIEVLGRVHSRLVQWSDFTAGVIAGDLATRWEQPDPLRLVLHVDPRARWQPHVSSGGRLTPGEVADWLRATVSRARGPNASPSTARREADWLSVEQVDVVNDRVVVRLGRPDPWVFMTLAGRFSLVAHPSTFGRGARESNAVDAVGGSGPFILEEVGHALRFRAYLDGHAPPLVETLEVLEPAEPRAQYLSGAVDEAILRDRREAPAVRAAAPATEWGSWYEDSPIVSTLAIDRPPWNDARLRRALSAALNRGVLAERLFGGRAEATGLAAPVHTAAFRQTTPPLLDGYRPRPEDDIREARALWEAAGGASLGKVTVDFPSVFDPAYSASSVVIDRLGEALGTGQFVPAVESYPAIAKKAAEGRYGNGRAALWFGWGPPFAEPDPTRWASETFAEAADSAIRGAARAIRDAPRLGDAAARFQELAALTADGAGRGILFWLTQKHEVARRAGLTRERVATAWWPQHLDASLRRES
ncbi:MAG: ABC transporter substrate-binding protein [Dehalococcoidia bacterium]